MHAWSRCSTRSTSSNRRSPPADRTAARRQKQTAGPKTGRRKSERSEQRRSYGAKIIGCEDVLFSTSSHHVHPTHSRGRTTGGFLLLLDLGDQSLGGDHETRDRRRVEQRGLGDLGRIDDAGLDQILGLVGRRVVA